ncbi:hypothetical protein ACIBL6_15875 [Streptomyces sp. NPDC050400]|uniref:hypothetical protein n=1 Tax=Streptomyces sp. NPDC050400 TaxID=3365610 RepID=UPI00379F04E6
MSGAQQGFGGLIQRGPMAADVVGAHYTTVFNQAVRDRRLSRRARGLLVELLSHREGYGISLEMLLAGGPEKRDALRAGLRELEQHGYLLRHRVRAAGGRLGETRYVITDMPDGVSMSAPPPQLSHSAVDEPGMGETSSRRSPPTSENPPLDDDPHTRRSEPRSDFPTLAEPTLAHPTHKKDKNFKKTNYQNTNPLPPSRPDAPERTGGTPDAVTARGEAALLAIARHHPELQAALATGSTLTDQAPLVGRLLEGGVSREHIREALIGRPYPPPDQRTHSLAALVAARLRQLAQLAARADRARTTTPAPPAAGDAIEHAYCPEPGPVAPRPECPGQDGLCGRPVGAPGELCPACRSRHTGD